MIMKRKFRWTCEWHTKDEQLIAPASFVKVSARPNLIIEETELFNGDEKYWIPGKATWESVNISYYDIDDEGRALFIYWMEQSSKQFYENNEMDAFKAVATLKMYDGCGVEIETWSLQDAFVKSIEYGSYSKDCDDNYTSIDVEIAYNSVKYENHSAKKPKSYPTFGWADADAGAFGWAAPPEL
jgi:hypothetical protein